MSDDELFNNLLEWLGGPPQYEDLRNRLIRILQKKGCWEAEDLFDETVNRVVVKLPEIRKTYVGKPLWYFIKVAHYVWLEWLRRTEISYEEVPEKVVQPEVNAALECLRQCLSSLPPDQHDLVLDYHVNNKRAKIELHQKMAEELGVSTNALRLRAHRIRVALEKCVMDCLNGVTT